MISFAFDIGEKSRISGACVALVVSSVDEMMVASENWGDVCVVENEEVSAVGCGSFVGESVKVARIDAIVDVVPVVLPAVVEAADVLRGSKFGNLSR